MHIVQLANFYGPRSGGLRTAVDQLAVEYIERGHGCSTIVPGGDDRIIRRDGRTIVVVKAPFVPGLGGYRAITNRSVVRSALRRLVPDVIELADKTTLVSPAHELRARGTPVVLISHERLDELAERAVALGSLPRRAARRYNARLVRRVDAIVCASAYATQEFDGLATPPSLHRVPLGVDAAEFVPATTGRDEVVRIMSAVRLSPEKSPDLIVDTARALVDAGVRFEWDVYGDGPARHELVRRAGDLPVHFAGFVGDRARLAAAMARADVGVAPSRFETFGLAALEFMAAGTPVVVPEDGALREIVAPGTGLVRPSDGRSFAAAISDLAAGDRTRQRARARSHAATLSWSRTADGMLDLFDSLTRRCPAREPESVRHARDSTRARDLAGSPERV